MPNVEYKNWNLNKQNCYHSQIPKAKPSNRPYKVENIDWAKIIHKFKQYKCISRWNTQRKKSEMYTKSMIKIQAAEP